MWCSSMAEQVAVNHKVGGSSPPTTANLKEVIMDQSDEHLEKCLECFHRYECTGDIMDENGECEEEDQG